MNYSVSRAYAKDETTGEMVKSYPITHKKTVFTNDDETETLEDKLTSIDGSIADHATQLSEKAKQSDLDTTNANVSANTNSIATNTANIATHTSQIASLASGSPKGVYSTVNALTTAYPTGNSNIYIVNGDIKEVETLTVTAIPTVAGNITITLNGTVFTVALNTAMTTTDAVATAIRGTTFTGWTTGGTGSVVTFTKTTSGANTTPVFSAGSTGATATIVVTITGVASDYGWYYWNGSAWTRGNTYQGSYDAETADIRNGVDGEVYTSAGNAVRVQFDVESSRVDTLFKTESNCIDFSIGGIYNGVTDIDSSIRVRSSYISLKKGTKIITKNNYQLNVHFYDSNHNYITNTYNTTGNWLNEYIIKSDSIIRIIARKSDNSTITNAFDSVENISIVSFVPNEIFYYFNNFAMNGSTIAYSDKRAMTFLYVDKEIVINSLNNYEFYIIGYDTSGTVLFNTYNDSAGFIKEYCTKSTGIFMRIIVRKNDDSNCTDLVTLYNNVIIKYANDIEVSPSFRQGFVIDRTNGETKLDDTCLLNDCFYELNGEVLVINSDNYFSLIFYDENYELINNTTVEPTLISRNYYCHIPSNIYNNSKYIRIETTISNINLTLKNGVYENNHDMNVYVSTDEADKFAEMIATANNGTECLQQAIWLSYLRGGKVILAEGDYYLNKFSNHTDSGNKHCLYFLHHTASTQFVNKSRFFTIEGAIASVGYQNGVRIIMSQDLYNSVGSTDEVSLIRSEYQSGFDVFTCGVSSVALKNITIIVHYSDKAITALDLSYTHCGDIDNVKCMAFHPDNGFDSYHAPPIANEKCYGIIGLMGSNWNTLNTFRNIEVIGFHIGFDISGEHCSVFNASAKFNWYGFTFGVLQKYGASQHPITCINMLDEHSVCMPQFSEAGSSNKQNVNIFGYNLMFPSWSSQGDITASDSRHHHAVENGGLTNGWGGVIYYNTNTNPADGSLGPNRQDLAFFETGGKNIKCVNGADWLAASTSYRKAMSPNYMQQCYDKDLKKLLIWDGTNWVDTNGNIVS